MPPSCERPVSTTEKRVVQGFTEGNGLEAQLTIGAASHV